MWHIILLLHDFTSSRKTSGFVKPQRSLLLLQSPGDHGYSHPYRTDSDDWTAKATPSSQPFYIGGEIGWIRFDLNPAFLCEANEDSSGPPSLLVVVHSHPLHKPQRDSIRATWGRITRDYERPDQVRLVFLLGVTDDQADMRSIRKESRMYRDVILADFLDTYRNLTVKSLTGLYWARTYCAGAPFILKTDDDVYFNVSGLLGMLPSMAHGTAILGALNPRAAVMRYGQWRVDAEQLPDEYYPPYCAGCAYLLRTEAARTIMSSFHTVPILPIEDVYVTGMVAKKTGLRCADHPLFPHWNIGPTRMHICKLVRNKLLAIHNVYYEMMYWIHDNVTKGISCGESPY